MTIRILIFMYIKVHLPNHRKVRAILSGLVWSKRAFSKTDTNKFKKRFKTCTYVKDRI